MSVEVTIICNGCSMVIAAGRTAKEARATVREPRDNGETCLLALSGGRDFCWDCSARLRTYGGGGGACIPLPETSVSQIKET